MCISMALFSTTNDSTMLKTRREYALKKNPFTFGGLQCGSANAEYALALVLEEDHVSTNLKV